MQVEIEVKPRDSAKVSISHAVLSATSVFSRRLTTHARIVMSNFDCQQKAKNGASPSVDRSTFIPKELSDCPLIVQRLIEDEQFWEKPHHLIRAKRKER